MTLVEYSESNIKDVKYIYDGTLTIAILTTLNDFKFVGQSHVVDINKYDQATGMKYAYQDAFKKLVEVCAYNLKSS